MKINLLKWLRCLNCGEELTIDVYQTEKGEIKNGCLNCSCGRKYKIVNYIPRFIDTDEYVDNFSFEWKAHKTTQLDSANVNLKSGKRFKTNLDFPLEDLKGKTVLDVGCGMGRFAEIVLKYGGTVIGIDMSFAVEAAFENMGLHSNAHFIQADLFRLPFPEGAFDLIYSLGVLHHTPNPKKAFGSLVRYLKKNGKISITLYSSYNKIYIVVTNFWRRVTTRLPQKLLYYFCFVAGPLYYLYKIPFLGYIGRLFFPISLNEHWRWRVLDTFDCYSPKYQFYFNHYEVFQWFEERGLKNIKVLKDGISYIAEK